MCVSERNVLPPEYLQHFSVGQPIPVEASCHVLEDVRTDNKSI